MLKKINSSKKTSSRTPRFSEPLHVGKPNICNLDLFLENVKDIFENRWFTNNGPYVQEFEKRLQNYLGVKHCITVCNATIGLSIAVQALGLSGEVIVPSFTFVATPHSLLWQNIRPVFCDIDLQTHNLDPQKVESLINQKTSAIMGVHVWGRPCAIDELSELSRKYNLRLAFDAAHAFACSHQGKMIGNFGDLEVFSFHATKFFNTFEGGAITTNDDELAAKIRLARNFGFSGIDQTSSLGTNGKMTEISAAMGLTSLTSLTQFVEKNLHNHQTYIEAFSKIPGINIQQYNYNEQNNYHTVIAVIDEDRAGFTRDALVEFLWKHNVFVRRYFYPGCHQMEPYKAEWKNNNSLPNTEYLCERVISFPNGMSIDDQEIEQIAELILEFRQIQSQVSMSEI